MMARDAAIWACTVAVEVEQTGEEVVERAAGLAGEVRGCQVRADTPDAFWINVGDHGIDAAAVSARRGGDHRGVRERRIDAGGDAGEGAAAQGCAAEVRDLVASHRGEGGARAEQRHHEFGIAEAILGAQQSDDASRRGIDLLHADEARVLWRLGGGGAGDADADAVAVEGERVTTDRMVSRTT